MNTHHRTAALITAILLGASVTAACSGSTGASVTSNADDKAPPSTGAGAGDSSAAADDATVPPTEVSDFPEGVYRTRIDPAVLQKAHADDPGNGGLWTLTVKDGTYQMDCAPVAAPGVDCGAAPISGTAMVELGRVRGKSPTVWFIWDNALKSKLTGCVLHSQEGNGCGADNVSYHMRWRVTPKGVTFSDFVALGGLDGFSAVNNLTIQPWTRIS